MEKLYKVKIDGLDARDFFFYPEAIAFANEVNAQDSIEILEKDADGWKTKQKYNFEEWG